VQNEKIVSRFVMIVLPILAGRFVRVHVSSLRASKSIQKEREKFPPLILAAQVSLDTISTPTRDIDTPSVMSHLTRPPISHTADRRLQMRLVHSIE